METLPMPLQFHLASQIGQAQRRRLPGCRARGGERTSPRRVLMAKSLESAVLEASDQPASAQLLHSPSFAESRAPSPVSAAERVSRGSLGEHLTDTLQRDQINKVTGKRYPKCLEPITALGDWGAGKRNQSTKGTELGVWGFR